MFMPMHNVAPAHVYPVSQVMKQGTAVKRAPGGFVVPALDGKDVIGFVAQDVIEYKDRPREFDLWPDKFFGLPFSPVMINRPGEIKGTMKDGGNSNIGVWMERNSMFYCDIRDEFGNSVQGLQPGQELMVGLTGLLMVQDGAVDGNGDLVRPTVAIVEFNGYTSFAANNDPGMYLPLNTNIRGYIVRLTANLGAF